MVRRFIRRYRLQRQLRKELRYCERWLSACFNNHFKFGINIEMDKFMEARMIHALHHPSYDYFTARRNRLKRIFDRSTNSSGPR